MSQCQHSDQGISGSQSKIAELGMYALVVLIVMIVIFVILLPFILLTVVVIVSIFASISYLSEQQMEALVL
jgi:hypothetical protein